MTNTETPNSEMAGVRSTGPVRLSLVDRLRKQGCAESVKDEAASRIEELEDALWHLLNDCINFDGGKLTDCIMEKASETLNKRA